MDTLKPIVVIGGGFAGLTFIKHTNRKKREIILIDKDNYNSFPPLFYQVASAGLDPSGICFAFRREMRSRRAKGCRYHMGKVKCIDTVKHIVHTQYETIEYGQLIIAAGTTNNFFGIKDLEKSVYTLKSTTQAIRCRNDILERLEQAAVSSNPDYRRRVLSFTIVGGGPAGVEIAGALGEMKRYILHREYPGISPDDVSVTLVEGSDRLLGTMSKHSSRKALEYLDSLMVNVKLGFCMQSYIDNTITFTNGEQLYSEMVIWTAGVTSNTFEFIGPQPQIGRGGRLIVDAYNRVFGIPDVFAIGDIAIMPCDTWPQGHPQVAQVAIQQAKTLAYNIQRGSFPKPFVYRDKGTMATVGRNRAVADLSCLRLYGRPAWFVWMAIHLMSLLGMRNRLTVFITWIWAYFSYSTSLRLILKPTRYPARKKI